MLYTLGRKSQYDKYIATDPNASKGIGGSVWKDRKDVEEYLKEFPQPEFNIYGVEADWLADTVLHECDDVSWNDLVRPAKLIKLEQ